MLFFFYWTKAKAYWRRGQKVVLRRVAGYVSPPTLPDAPPCPANEHSIFFFPPLFLTVFRHEGVLSLTSPLIGQVGGRAVISHWLPRPTSSPHQSGAGFETDGCSHPIRDANIRSVLRRGGHVRPLIGRLSFASAAADWLLEEGR